MCFQHLYNTVGFFISWEGANCLLKSPRKRFPEVTWFLGFLFSNYYFFGVSGPLFFPMFYVYRYIYNVLGVYMRWQRTIFVSPKITGKSFLNPSYQNLPPHGTNALEAMNGRQYPTIIGMDIRRGGDIEPLCKRYRIFSAFWRIGASLSITILYSPGRHDFTRPFQGK